MGFWEKLTKELSANNRVVLLYVIQSIGSSPGRQGFKMLVSESGQLYGSIGGGIMEHKLVEWCKNDLLATSFQPFIKRQVHQNNIKKDKSGMICSGEQTIAFYHLTYQDLSIIKSIASNIGEEMYGVLCLNKEGILFKPSKQLPANFHLSLKSTEEWVLLEDVGFKPQLHILGGGHVSLSLTKLASQLGFSITVYDDRDGLNTVESNDEAVFHKIPDYECVDDYIPQGNYHYVVLMSFGYRTDKVILKRLIDKEYKYLGMMGSKKKVEVLFQELKTEGVPQKLIDKVHSPIGLPINSKTPEEIAISILAELIKIKNVAE